MLCRWWFLTALGRSLLLNFIFLHGVNAADPYQWRYPMLLLLFGTALLHEYVRPFAHDSDNSLRAIADLLLFWVGILEILAGEQEPPAVADPNNPVEEEKTDASLPMTLMIPALVGFGSLFVLSVLRVAKTKRAARQQLFQKVQGLKQRWTKAKVRGPTTWTIIRQCGPNHLGLRYNAIPEHQMSLITSGCAPCRASSTWSEGPTRCARSPGHRPSVGWGSRSNRSSLTPLGSVYRTAAAAARVPGPGRRRSPS